MPTLAPVSSAFWQARDSWAAQRPHVERMRRAAGIAISGRTFAGQASRWQDEMARGVQVRTLGRSRQRVEVAAFSATVDPALEAWVLEAMQAVVPIMLRAFDDELGKFAFRIWRKWPVQSGFSRSNITLEYLIKDIKFIGRIGSRAPYTLMIKSRPWQKAVNQGRQLSFDVGRRVVQELAAHLQGSTGGRT